MLIRTLGLLLFCVLLIIVDAISNGFTNALLKGWVIGGFFGLAYWWHQEPLTAKGFFKLLALNILFSCNVTTLIYFLIIHFTK